MRAKILEDRRVSLRWNSVGPGYRYNIYSALANQPQGYEVENDKPLSDSGGIWIPPANPGHFLFVVTALDKEGRESARSRSVYVDLRQ